MTNIAIFASGSGSNFEAIASACINGEINANVALLVCNKPQAYVIQRAKRLDVPVFICKHQDYPTRSDHEKRIITELAAAKVKFVALAGYGRLFSNTFICAYNGKIINIHPALLPAFPGLDSIAAAFNSGVNKTGVTVHYCDEGMDTGPIIAQREVPILPDDTLETLEARVHQTEHELYVEVLKSLFNEMENSK